MDGMTLRLAPQVQGKVYIFDSATIANAVSLTSSDADYVITGISNMNFGASIDLGDIDGDGKDDLVVGAPGYHDWSLSYGYSSSHTGKPIPTTVPWGAFISTQQTG